MRWFVLFAVLLSLSRGAAVEPGYELALGAEMRGGTLSVSPVISGPPHKNLRYDVVITRSGRSGKGESRQSGNVTVGAGGTANLSQVSISVSEGDRYEVSVKVYDGAQIVAAKTSRQPE